MLNNVGEGYFCWGELEEWLKGLGFVVEEGGGLDWEEVEIGWVVWCVGVI